jgi:hypothetical protein
MSEMEQLKEETEKQFLIQRYTELNNYIDTLSADIDLCMKRNNDANLVYGVAWISWVAVGFFAKEFDYLFAMIFMMALIYSGYRHSKLARAFGKFFGAIKVLEIMGFMDKTDTRGKKKKRKILNEFADTVKGWFAQKKEAQDQVYAPA